MNHVQRRLASTAAKLASVSPSTLASFPPVESFKTKKDEFIKKDEFNPESWAAIQPVPSTALSAFAHRIGLASVLSSPEIVRQACTHPSFLPLYRQHYPQLPEPKTNAQFAALGNSLLGLFATEYIQAKYPYLPTRVLKAAVSAHVGPMTASSVAQEMGAQPLLRWHRTVSFTFPYNLPASKVAFSAQNPHFIRCSLPRCACLDTPLANSHHLPRTVTTSRERVCSRVFPE